MQKRGSAQNLSLVVAYLLIIVLGAWMVLSKTGSSGETWQCSNVACSRMMTSQEWVAQNCAVQDNQVVCALDVNGQTAVVPLDQLNLTNLQACAEYKCVLESKVRTVDYPINLTQQAAPAAP